MFGPMILFGEEISIPSSALDKACISAINAIKKELPEEAQVYGVISEVLERCKSEIELKRIIL